jgi:hypothetical protein
MYRESALTFAVWAKLELATKQKNTTKQMPGKCRKTGQIRIIGELREIGRRRPGDLEQLANIIISSNSKSEFQEICNSNVPSFLICPLLFIPAKYPSGLSFGSTKTFLNPSLHLTLR